MKKIHSIYLILLSVFLLGACEKGFDSVDSGSTVYLPSFGISSHSVLLGESIFELGVYRSGVNYKDANVTVDFKIDQEAFTTFLASNPGYEILPEKYYSIESFHVTFLKGEERESFKIHLKNIDESFVNKKYILPVSITKASGSVELMEKQKTVLLNFSRYRNAYECKYKAFGTITTAGSATPYIKVDEQINATTASVNSISVKGFDGNMNILLTVLNNEVIIRGASDSSSFNVKNTPGKSSTFTGKFDPTHQRNKGTFNLFYTYTLNGQQMNAEVELKFWL